MRIVAAPNAFKGSISAVEAARAIKKGAHAVHPEFIVDCVPVSDGGDGLLEVMTEALSGKIIHQSVSGPLLQKESSRFCYVEKDRVAIIEMAQASGLALLHKEQLDPTKTTTYGTGQLILAALDIGAKRIVVGLGGSATCDGGIGAGAALGFRFLDKYGAEVAPVGGSLLKIHSIDTSLVDRRIALKIFEAVCDVTNPLTGLNGASYVYSPQKGASTRQVKILDEGLENLAAVIKRDLGIDIGSISGAGAAGGLAGGLHAFCGAALKKGTDLVLDIVGLRDTIRGADLVITAEGQIDYQTQYDKAPAGVARMAKNEGIPCIAICGSVGEKIDELYNIGFQSIFSICKGPQSLESAISDGSSLLQECAEQVVRTFLAGKNSS